MTEEIIIDGVNVAGCDGLNKILLPLKQCNLLQFKTRDGGVAGRWCTDHSNCYYKQLKKLEQENKELKKQIESDKGLITIGGKQQYKMTKAYDKCKTALEEINLILDELKQQYDYMTDYSEIKEIQDKINEVLQ